jgi:hypothetical protein
VGHPEQQRGGRGIPPGTVNKQAGPGWRGSGGSGVRTQQPGVGKTVRVAEGGIPTGQGRKTHFPREL